jgi:hypothetical protein
MKSFLLLFSLIFFISINSNAQECSYAKSAKAKVDKTHCTASAAAKMAALDEHIESRTCPQTGKVSYVRKSVCPQSGKTTLTDVEYCSKTSKFINVSPRQKSCTKQNGAAGSKAKATKAANKSINCSPAQKAACAKTCAKSCAGGQKAGAKASASQADAKPTLVKQ